ncbi:MAG TPA: translocation/assembly module TamB domain-containing protein [Syntrophales bacterium]|nr:translocation/assembly module TamB domain-containing protein [Syntrophales bacterium]HPI57813.1 translocation/assembly module TamB domain-containing protein [Syntrophales bacterium]HPN25527.1 translocation/assembly module TamB domain-containing protein [Syntrophales bacterium]HQM28473.1 translocation/assembly module TamB domain-containing protein [Syntrophales bacterium]
MKRRSIIGCSILSLALTAMAVIVWLFCTSAGTRLVLETLFRWMPVSVEAERITGRLADGLTLEGVRVKWESGEAQVANLRMSLEPLYLLAGSVSIDEMEMHRVSIVDNSPERGPPYDLEWPRAPLLLSAVRGRIGEFHVKDASYQKPGKLPVTLREGRGEVIWARGSNLTVRNLVLRLQDAQAEGSVQAGFLFPSLQASLSVALDKAVAKCNAFSLTADLASGQGPEQVSGPIHLSASSGTEVIARLEGEIGLTRKALLFRNLQFKDDEKRTMVNVDGQVDVSTAEIVTGAEFRVEIPEGLSALLPLALTGTLEIRGSPDHYTGDFTLKNEGETWRSAFLSGILSGNRESVRVTGMTGRFLEGTLKGELRGSWDKRVSVKASLQARNLNPALIAPELAGRINLNAEGAAHWPQSGSLEARVKCELLESRLRDRALTGVLDAQQHAGIIRLNRLFLKGAGFEMRAAGALEERLTWGVQISDLSALMPDNRGRASASGWVHRDRELLGGAMTLRGNDLFVSGMGVAAIAADAEMAKGEPRSIDGRANLKGFTYGPVKINNAQVKTTGQLEDHTIYVFIESPGARGEVALRGSYAKAVWKGTLETLKGSDALGSWGLESPVSLLVSAKKMSVSPARITSTSEEAFETSMDLSLNPARGALLAEWQRVNLARLSFFLPDWQIGGQTEGHLRADFRGKNRTTISSSMGLEGSLARGSSVINVKEASGKLEWNEGGLLWLSQADFTRGGRLVMRFTSPEPARPGLPGRGDFRFSAENVDAALIQPWFPQALSMTGIVSCTAEGKLLPGMHLDASGELKVSQGVFSLQEKKGVVTARAERAQLRWAWRGQTLSGDIDLLLTNHGFIKADFRFPIAAKLPLQIEEKGPVQLTARADMQERGLLSAIFPGLIQESRGHFLLNGSVDGMWKTPKVHGTMRIDQAGAYLPSTGVQLSDAEMEARFEDQVVYITSYGVRSGPGRIEGKGTLWIKDRGIDRFETSLTGERFQAVRLPEMEMLASPRLAFEGSPKKVQVRGSVTIPELLIRGSGTEAVARPSKDVVRVDESLEKDSGKSFPLDMQVRVILGDRAFVKAAGLDARLEGDVLLTAETLDAIKAKGEIRLRDGTYSTTGVRLVITRGRVVFDGGPADQPKLDVLALRTIEERPDQAGQSLGRFKEVKAGIIITGTPLAPLVRLYSEPSMPDADILGYIVVGKPTSGDEATSALLASAAEALLSGGGSESTLSKLRSQFGPDTVDIKSDKTGSTTQSIVTVGKYLQPKLYVSYGRSLFNEDYYITLRYTLSKRWEVESKAGAQTGANIYYRIEFD